MTADTVLLVSEDAGLRDSVPKFMVAAGLDVEVNPSVQAWLETPEPPDLGCVVLDVAVSDVADPERLRHFTALCASLPVLVLTPRGDVPMAVLAIKHGAVDVLQKPPCAERLLERVRWTLARRSSGTNAAAR